MPIHHQSIKKKNPFLSFVSMPIIINHQKETHGSFVPVRPSTNQDIHSQTLIALHRVHAQISMPFLLVAAFQPSSSSPFQLVLLLAEISNLRPRLPSTPASAAFLSRRNKSSWSSLIFCDGILTPLTGSRISHCTQARASFNDTRTAMWSRGWTGAASFVSSSAEKKSLSRREL